MTLIDDLAALLERPGLKPEERAVLKLGITLLDGGPVLPISGEELQSLPCKILVEMIDWELNLKLR